MSSILENNINLINNLNTNTLSTGGTVKARLTLNPDYYKFTASSAGELTLNFVSPYTFDWDEYKLSIFDASNNNVLNEPVIIRSDRTITANLPKKGLYTLMVEAALPQYPLPDADYEITATSFVKAKPTVSIVPEDTPFNEGTASKVGLKEYTQFKFKIILSEALKTAETVNYTILAISDFIDINDFDPKSPFSGKTVVNEKSASVSFAKNQTEKTIVISVAKDSLEEGMEQFAVRLINPSNGIKLDELNYQAGTVILNDDTSSFASIANVTAGGVFEGTGTGFTTHLFEVTLDKPTLSEQTLDYMIVFGTNSADKLDFGPTAPTSTAATVTFAKGASKATIEVSIAQDSIAEAFESYAVRLSNPSAQMAISIGEAQGLIMNDDKPSELKWSTEKQDEVIEGKKITYNVSLDKAATTTQTINWTIQGYAENQLKPTNDSDFKKTSGSFTIAKDKKEASFTIETTDDSQIEGDEYFKIALQNPTGGLYIDPIGYQKLTLLQENDFPSTVTVTRPVPTLEGGSGKRTDLSFKITLDNAPTTPQTINWSVSNIDGLNAIDFVGNKLPSGTLTIPSNSKSATITFAIQGDNEAESNEAALLKLTTVPSSSLILDSGSKDNTKLINFEILNDDGGIVGTNKNDTLNGTDSNDLILGLDGNDMINGLRGADFIYGGKGNDTISVISGDSDVLGGDGNDTIIAILNSTSSLSATLNGDAGNDTVKFYGNQLTANASTNTLTGPKPGELKFYDFNRYELYGINNTLIGTSNNETFVTDGDNTFLTGGGGTDTFIINEMPILISDIKTIRLFDFTKEDRIITGTKTPLTHVNGFEFTGKAGETIITWLLPYYPEFNTSIPTVIITIDQDGNKSADIKIELIGEQSSYGTYYYYQAIT